ncbi:MAG TPA: type III pantothenate kinase, partial [Xanthobacteraceae bacterium]|nr:type III pantothenate kinase [Xanthobacteraceae bacterium]
IASAVIGTVVPAALYHLRRLCRDWFTIEPLVARSTLDWGFDIRVVNPAEVGADRLLNTLAAHRHFGGPLIIVDFGTATTFDLVSASGAYKGGIIAPGINLSLDALVNAAAKLPRIAIEAPEDKSVIGRTTESQMIIGIYWGYVAMIEGLVARMKQELGRPAKVITTGGLATLFDQHTDVFDAIEPDLTIQGLSLLYDMATR